MIRSQAFRLSNVKWIFIGFYTRNRLFIEREIKRGNEQHRSSRAMPLPQKILYRYALVHAATLYSFARIYWRPGPREKEREEKPLLVRSFRRRYIGDGMELHASFRDWRLSQGVKRLTDPRPWKEGGEVENARGVGSILDEGRGQDGLERRKRERERDGDNRWEWMGDGCCHLAMHASSFMSLDSR